MTERDDEAVLRHARQLFREQEGTLSPEIRQALAERRRLAVTAAGQRRGAHLPRVGVLGPAVAAALVLAIWLWPGGSGELPAVPADPIALTDLELLLSAEDWDLMEDLEFYLVLGELDEALGHG